MKAVEYYTQQQVDKTLDEVLEFQRKRGIYAPLLSRIRIYMDDEIPLSDREGMRKKSHAPMCVSAGMRLNIMRKYIWKTLNEARTIYMRGSKAKSNGGMCTDLYTEVSNILIHELTHALCQHIYQTNNFLNEKAQNGKILSKEYMAWVAACEVEANRGYGINGSFSPVYNLTITDTYTYPKAQSAKYLKDIYEVILKEYGDELEQDAEDVERELEKIVKEAQQEGDDKQGGKNGEQEDSGTGQEGQSTNGNGEKGENGEGSEGEGDKNSSQDGSEGGGERQAQIRAIAKAMNDAQQSMQSIQGREYRDDFDSGNTQELDYTGDSKNAYGVGGGTIDASGKTLKEVVKEWENIYNKNVIAKALERLKGNMVGTIAKERVSTYSRQARRDTSDGLLKKGTKRSSRSCPKILVALDKSGSMDSTTMAQATEALSKIFDVTGRPTQGCWICLHDGDVKNVNPFKSWKTVVANYYPDGGNDFSEVIKTANKLNVDVVLNVGDGGDTIARSKDACNDFHKAGRRWIDVNIAKGSREYNYEWMIDVAASDYAKTGIVREWEDLTGGFELSKEDIIKKAQQQFPKECQRWK